MKQGRRLTLEEVAEGALVSRATADRYFSSVDARARRGTDRRPDREDLFRDVSVDDPIERLMRVESALHDMISANEPSLRLMLAHSLRRSLNGDPGDGLPVRQNRRTALIEAAMKGESDRRGAR
jgi:AcrR family transcriptional regulator